ncbi:hypothetical protein RERY_23900 [Rhodococcus erythropolis]|nr:hypothetical protein RERY_23900 [Rhodococcus erythropolis]OQM77750.1 hypothetical protein B0E55_06342 [Rhodococcus sp. 66b]
MTYAACCSRSVLTRSSYVTGAPETAANDSTVSEASIEIHPTESVNPARAPSVVNPTETPESLIM